MIYSLTVEKVITIIIIMYAIVSRLVLNKLTRVYDETDVERMQITGDGARVYNLSPAL